MYTNCSTALCVSVFASHRILAEQKPPEPAPVGVPEGDWEAESDRPPQEGVDQPNHGQVEAVSDRSPPLPQAAMGLAGEPQDSMEGGGQRKGPSKVADVRMFGVPHS